jgi:DNA (cytosine-5)-methyltransferase 1
MNRPLSCLEICAGAGGQSLGLEKAGFFHELAVEIDPDACQTLRLNRGREFHQAGWKIREGDVRDVSGREYRGQLALIAGGVPCPPFSIAGKQLGRNDERDLFPEALRLVAEARPEAVMLENVRGLASEKFTPYRSEIQANLDALGYWSDWKVLNASEFGLAQLRPRFILVALRRKYRRRFKWPQGSDSPPTVGKTLYEMMAEKKWPGAQHWADVRANDVGPTLVGGSRKHGGPDLGPTRARAAWLQLGVDGRALANEAPDHLTDPMHTPRLTLQMAAALQGFPPEWEFHGRKTAAYRQIGNAFPPPVAEAVGGAIAQALGVGTLGLPNGPADTEACSA